MGVAQLVEGLSCVCEALGSILNTTNKYGSLFIYSFEILLILDIFSTLYRLLNYFCFII